MTGRDVPGHHDRNNIFSRLRLLDWEQTLGRLAQGAGGGLMVVALIWGGYWVYLQYAVVKEH